MIKMETKSSHIFVSFVSLCLFQYNFSFSVPLFFVFPRFFVWENRDMSDKIVMNSVVLEANYFKWTAKYKWHDHVAACMLQYILLLFTTSLNYWQQWQETELRGAEFACSRTRIRRYFKHSGFRNSDVGGRLLTADQKLCFGKSCVSRADSKSLHIL